MSQNREFEQYLQGKSGLSGLYASAPQPEPPDHLDAAILAEAHRAVGARPGGKHRPRWFVPLSMVASVFALVMIGLQVPHLLRDFAPQMPVETASPERIAKEETSRQAPAGIAAMDKIAPAPAERKAALIPEQKQAEIQGAAPAAPRAEAYAPQNAPEARAMAKPAPQAAIGQMTREPVMHAAPPPPAAAPEQPLLKEQAEFEQARAPSKAKKSAARAESNVSDYAAAPAPAAATMAAPEPVPIVVEAKPAAKAEAGGASQRPEDWLARIKQLKQQGKLEEARKEMAAFKKRYPDYPVPKDMGLR